MAKHLKSFLPVKLEGRHMTYSVFVRRETYYKKERKGTCINRITLQKMALALFNYAVIIEYD
jgi:hypothetical protein